MAVTLDAGATEEAALHIHGQSAAGASHDVLVEDSKILGRRAHDLRLRRVRTVATSGTTT